MLAEVFVPMAVTACIQQVVERFCDEDVNKIVFHGHTFMANPASSSAALTSPKLTLADEKTSKHSKNLQSTQSLSKTMDRPTGQVEVSRR